MCSGIVERMQMSEFGLEPIESLWCRIGVLLPVAPAKHSPDPDRPLLDTARQLSSNSRLFVIAASWLVSYDAFVAKHRLKRLITTELETEHQAGLGLLLETAVELGASRELLIAAAVCRPAAPARPLFAAYRIDAAMAELARSTASTRSQAWGVWAPEIQTKNDILRPARWVLNHNDTYAARAIRKGDLRCSILESLRRDSGGEAESEAQLARLSGATRAAVRKSLAALVLEGEVQFVGRDGGKGERGERLCRGV
jgi:hypothetical protein